MINKILYEASYIGSPKSFFMHAITIVMLVFVTVRSICRLKRIQDTNIEEMNFRYKVNCIQEYIVMVVFGIVGLLVIIGTINSWNEDILGYKKGKYREVEGIVEDYTDTKNGYTFTVKGVEFEVSMAVLTWGYTYRYKKDVITGDGQHLRIRYTWPTTILYIEEIVDTSMRSDNTEKVQQVDMAQEKDIEEPIIPIDQIGIQGRTEEETELIRKILSQDKEEFQEYLMTDWNFPHAQEAIEITAYDFTKDGKDEIIVSKFYVSTSAVLTYNYVYDQNGKRVLEFVGNHPLEMQIIDDWDGDGTLLIYTKNHYGANYNANIYTEIRCENDVLTEKVILMELDRRQEYYIFTDFTKEEEEKLWAGGLGVNELTETKEYVREDKNAEEYKQLFKESETTSFSWIGMIRYSKSEGFKEYTEED